MALLAWFWQQRMVRYLIAGATGASVHLGTVYVLTHLWGWWHITATSIGFLFALVVSFTLQKFLTFQNHELTPMPRQGMWYSVVACTNFFLNGVLMFVFVDLLDMWPVVGQVCTSLALAVGAYLAYARIFAHSRAPSGPPENSLTS